jgi:hypothetical protein
MQPNLFASSAFLALFILLMFQVVTGQSLYVSTNQVAEWGYESKKEYQNPFKEVSVSAIITDSTGQRIEIPGYWAGDNYWKFRFSSPTVGTYRFVTVCNDPKNQSLHQQKGNITITEYSGSNPVYAHGALRVSPLGNYLAHQDGTPFFWLADSWWHGMTERLDFPAGFEQLADDRQQKGFNVIQFAIAFPCDIAPFDPRGQNAAGDPWDQDFTSINPAYFDLVDQRLQMLLDKGLVPNIVGLWGYYMKYMGVDTVKKHWAYLIARYGAYPVTYTLSGETTLAYYTDLEDRWDYYKDQFRTQWSEVARFIQENDPYNRLLTTHPGPGIHDGKNPIYEMQHLDMVMLQSGHGGFATMPNVNRFIEQYQDRFPDKPVIHGEVCFEGMAGSSWQDVQRLLFWSNVLQGTPGYSYGVEGIWQFNVAGNPFGPSPTGDTWGNIPWTEAMHYPGGKQLGHGAEWLRKLPWWQITAAPERANYHATAENFYDPYVAEMGSDVLLYFTKVGFKKNKLKVVGLEPNAQYAYRFFDPITAREYPAVAFAADAQGEWQVPSPPVMQDWVVLIVPV